MKGWISWFARNGVAANLLMIAIVAAGIIAMTNLVLEVFPEYSTQTLSVTVPYLGAAPEEVEEGVVVRIEEAIQDLEGVKKIRSNASEGLGMVLVELEFDADPRDVLDDVKSRVDAIETFPEETEEPIVQELQIKRKVISLALSGDVDERTLKHLAELTRDELTALPGITQIELTAARPYEIAIEVSETTLRRYGLTFEEVVRAVRSSSLDLPGGAVKSDSGEILLRTKGQAYDADQFGDIVLRADAGGTRLLLRDVAEVIDGFAETDEAARFDGEPAILVDVFRVGDQSALEVADAVKGYTRKLQANLPPGIHMTAWQDDTVVLRDRMRVLLENGRMGLVLVFLVLALFLRLRLALWVSVGIGVSFLGAVAIMPTFDISVNVLSLFAFIMVLGIVVDDAIVVGENIYRHFEKGKSGLRAAVDGAREVAIPVTFSILTTLAAFSPLVSIPGGAGQIMRTVPLIVMACLVFSLIESVFVLPNHLSHMSHEKEERHARRRSGLSKRVAEAWSRFQGIFRDGLSRTVDRFYGPLLERAIEWRYTSAAVALVVLMLTFGLVGAGWVKFTFMPTVEADNAVALLTLPQGTPVERTLEAIAEIERAGFELGEELEREGHEGAFRHVLATVGSHPFAEFQSQNAGPTTGGMTVAVASSHLGEVNIELAPAEERTIGASEVVRRWREKTQPILDAVQLDYSANMMSFGAPIDLQLTAYDLERLRAAVAELKAALREYPGVLDIADSYRAGKREIQIDITPRGEALGLSLSRLAEQVRQGFYGAEAQRIQRGRDDVRVMVRYPREERETLASLEQMRIRTPDGAEVPFSVAGEARLGRGFSAIQRTDRRRTMNVTADIDPAITNANEVVADLQANVLPEILERHPGVSYALAGEQESQREVLGALGKAFGLALIAIYALLAVPFRSYFQPLIVMSAIPFGVIGAVLGHMILGMDLTMLSMFGVVALTGVVVNDSLVMVDFINRRVRSGHGLDEAIRLAGAERFRPILLTSLTTFVGLTPLLLEKSLQAQFLVPMATSLAFGVLFATGITLLLVPVLYRILADLRDPRHRTEQELQPSDSTGIELPVAG